jgi:hypothetical protein
MLKQKETALEKMRTVVRQLDEDNRKYQSKIKTLNRRLASSDYAFLARTGESTSPEEMRDVASLRQSVELLEGWRKIAQCSVCNYRAKSHVLMRCMHVFCKECIDKRIETRQRKCPTCGGSFGTNEVKQIWI